MVAVKEKTQEQLIRNVAGIKDVAEHFEVSKRCIMNWISAGTFPRPYRIGRRTLRWDILELNSWIEDGCPRIEEK